MRKKSPRKRSQKTIPTSSPAEPKPKAPPINVKKQRLPADEEARARQSRKDSAEIEYYVWRSIYC